MCSLSWPVNVRHPRCLPTAVMIPSPSLASVVGGTKTAKKVEDWEMKRVQGITQARRSATKRVAGTKIDPSFPRPRAPAPVELLSDIKTWATVQARGREETRREESGGSGGRRGINWIGGRRRMWRAWGQRGRVDKRVEEQASGGNITRRWGDEVRLKGRRSSEGTRAIIHGERHVEW